jgi:probable rRNA maturation factor
MRVRSARQRRGLEADVIGAPADARRARDLARWLERTSPGRARGRVAIALVSDAAMRRLNRTHRHIDRTTDVLSFPSEDAPGFLGDLAISLPAARRQAREYGHSTAEELRILALHGLLHLLGYDHETDQGEMEKVEERFRRRAGLPAGLIGRPSRAPRRTAKR